MQSNTPVSLCSVCSLFSEIKTFFSKKVRAYHHATFSHICEAWFGFGSGFGIGFTLTLLLARYPLLLTTFLSHTSLFPHVH